MNPWTCVQRINSGALCAVVEVSGLLFELLDGPTHLFNYLENREFEGEMCWVCIMCFIFPTNLFSKLFVAVNNQWVAFNKTCINARNTTQCHDIVVRFELKLQYCDNKLSKAPSINLMQNIFAIYDLLLPNGLETFDTGWKIFTVSRSESTDKNDRAVGHVSNELNTGATELLLILFLVLSFFFFFFDCPFCQHDNSSSTNLFDKWKHI